MKIDDFFKHLWQDYIAIAPAAKVLHDAVAARGETIVNDHVAFRTFDIEPINLDALEKHVLALCYTRFAPYEFKEKKLHAFGDVHPDATQPRVFLSELKTAECSPLVRAVARTLCGQIDPARVASPDVLWAGPLWQPVPYDVYQAMLEESEYAGWVAALGLHANHFTISVNHLKTMTSLEELLDFVESQGYALNTSGGRVKGSPEVLLEQASTLADRREIAFAFGERHAIPTCYYEFARRYPGPDGRIYDGFVAASADKIFESTNAKKREG
jgi:hypothetical protein